MFATTENDLNVANIFGITLLQSRNIFIADGMTMYEESDKSKRLTRSWLVPEEKVTGIDGYGGVTIWHFHMNSPTASQGCWHGNSQHCCGRT
jgi:hypothetical protein